MSKPQFDSDESILLSLDIHATAEELEALLETEDAKSNLLKFERERQTNNMMSSQIAKAA